MNIALLHDSLGRSRGGIEAWLYHCAATLMAMGHEVTCAAVSHTEPRDDAMPLCVSITRLAAHGSLRVPGLGDWSWYRRLVREIDAATRRVDVFWSRSYMMTLAAQRIANGRPVIFIQADAYPQQLELYAWKKEAEGTSLRALQRRVRLRKIRRYERLAMRRADALVYLSRAMRENVLDYYGESFRAKTYVIAPGVDTKRFAPASPKRAGNGPLRVLSVGRLCREKNFECFIDAIAVLCRRGIGVEATIVGEGPLRSELEERARRTGVGRAIRFVGRRSDVERFYADSEVFVLVSTLEGFGAVYLEALASGLPCVALRMRAGRIAVASEEIIDHERTGLLVAENSPHLVADSIERMHSNPTERAQWANQARKSAETRFAWETTVTRLLDLSHTLAERRGRSDR